MKAITAAYNIMPFMPWVYKRNYDRMISPVPGSEYYDNDVPYEGVHINFVNSLQAVSGWDFEVEYVHGSRASRKVHPSSPGTAAVQDVMDGLVDVAIGPTGRDFFFLRTSRMLLCLVIKEVICSCIISCFSFFYRERLKMTSFTMPIRKL